MLLSTTCLIIGKLSGTKTEKSTSTPHLACGSDSGESLSYITVKNNRFQPVLLAAVATIVVDPKENQGRVTRVLKDGGAKADVDIKDEAAATLFTRYSFSTWFGRCCRCGMDEILKVPCEAGLIVILARRACCHPVFCLFLW